MNAPFLTQTSLATRIWGIVLTFAYTGFFGWTLGPILNFYIHAFANGPQIVMMAAGGTGLIFLGLSAIAMNPKRDFSHWGAFLSMGAILCIIAVIVNLFLKLPAVQLAISVFASIVSGGFILYQTNAIVQGGERNYVTATVVLYVSIMNIFLTLLQVLSL
ncbi:MAG: BAX inhibitor (BI)-1/YccA family protein, partial [Gammaproteobacteria bacterium]|nr:BAX inhibitor (BI)-1/YccA family protein [Gammaproteobacteria bacterium]